MVEAEAEIRKMARINKRVLPEDYFKQFQVSILTPWNEVIRSIIYNYWIQSRHFSPMNVLILHVII